MLVTKALARTGPRRMLLLFLIVGATALLAGYSRSQDSTEQQRQVETGLVRKIQIKGEPVHKWTIAERLQHYHVPGVSVALVSTGSVAWAKGY